MKKFSKVIVFIVLGLWIIGALGVLLFFLRERPDGKIAKPPDAQFMGPQLPTKPTKRDALLLIAGNTSAFLGKCQKESKELARETPASLKEAFVMIAQTADDYGKDAVEKALIDVFDAFKKADAKEQERWCSLMKARIGGVAAR